MNARPYIVDFDDYCDATVGELEYVRLAKEKWPALKVTLFAIPARCIPSTIQAVRDLNAKYLDPAVDVDDWLTLAPHGYFHTKGECLGWSAQEAQDKIGLARDMGITAPIFRAPGWLLDADVYEACGKVSYIVASHREMRVPFKGRVPFGPIPEYVYNDPAMRFPRSRAIHGHMTPVSGNYIKDMWEDGRFSVPPKHNFLHTWEAGVVEKV